MANTNIYTSVDEHYSRLARESNQETAALSEKVALSFGYSVEELATIPEGANLGVSCGNPIALAALKEGETVVDLGSGAGFDVFLAARKVGEKGTAIGVDMSKDMLARARTNASKTGITNVQFVESTITSIDLPSATTDCVISNCVINLVPESDKHLVFSEIFRVLKSGGRVAVSDILARKEFTEELSKNMSLYVGCISGASKVDAYAKYLRDVGFQDIMIVDKHIDLNVYKENGLLIGSEDQKAGDNQRQSSNGSATGDMESKSKALPLCCPPTKLETGSSCCGSKNVLDQSVVESMADIDFNEWAGSFNIYAVKP